MTSRPRVYTRIRPLNDNEKRNGGEVCMFAERGHHDVLVFEKDGDQNKTRFDYVFDAQTTQDQLFKHIGTEVLNTLFSGYNASVFAYGQTGSGKTHTMEGDNTTADGPGLIPRLMRAIFEKFQSNPDITDAKLEISFVQIYQEKIQDLLNGRKQLEIHMDRTSQYVAKDATWRLVRNQDEGLHLYVESVKNRSTSATEMNLVSSRSHTILMLKLQWDEPMLPGSSAQLNLIDLAGSEKLYQSGATGETMKEAIHINKSLSALGNVVSKLVDQVKHKDRRVHVPYKDSKLTYLLQSSLGGANLVHFILSLSGSSLWKPESLATIEFGKRALQLVIRPVRNAIDYKRLEEMEAMIEKMRTHIRSLEDELRTNQSSKTDQAAFLQIKHLHQEGEDRKRRKADAMKRSNTKAQLKTRTELNRIISNLPETLEDLTSHCVLFPASKIDFRQLGGIEKLIQFIDKSPSTFYRAHAAHTVAHVIDDEGRDLFASKGGMDALSRLLQVKEERCKEASCVAIEAVCRNSLSNKKAVTSIVYDLLVELIYGYANQQVQEAACTAIAAIVDNFPDAKKALAPLDIVKKLLDTIRNSPAEVVHVTKAATTCIGRLAHGDPEMQASIARLGGVDLLIDVLFSPVGDRDHQVPILASYALVNLCCSNGPNMAIVKKNPQFDEVRYRLMEGLSRAFGNNTVREGFGRATAQEAGGPFPYFGVTVTDKWTPLTCGGRPIFSTFMENPQFYLYVHEDTQLSLLIQDVLYEQRMQQKQRNNTVYMGIAVFQGDPELAKAGLKQLDFHGKMVEIAKFTSNCENVLHCVLKASEHPYMLVPFTSQRGRLTDFALSAFGDRKIELTAVPEMTGWVRTIIDGNWTEFTGRAGDNFDWRCNPQIRLSAKDNAARVVFVLSYRSLDEQRNAKRDDGDEDRQNNRPRLHGRVFSTQHVNKRYLKSLVPLPQGSTFIASNSFSSNSYITTTTSIQAGQSYVYIPFTETPFVDSWRLCVYCDNDEVDVEPIAGPTAEWNSCTFSGMWAGKTLTVSLKAAGKICVVVYSKDAFLRLSLANPKGEKLVGIDSFWNGEANVEFELPTTQTQLVVVVEGMMKKDGVQQLAEGLKFDLCVFTDEPCSVVDLSFPAKPSALTIPTKSTAKDMLQYPIHVADVGQGAVHENSDDDDTGEDEERDDTAELQAEVEKKTTENSQLQARIRELEDALAQANAKKGSLTPPATPTGAPPATKPPSRSHSGSNLRGGVQPAAGLTGGINGRRLSQGATTPAPPHPTRNEAEMGRAIDDVLLKLNASAAQEKPPSMAEWTRIRQEIRDCQTKLVSARAPS